MAHRLLSHNFMTDERYNELSENEDASLTADEVDKGWHFCWEWDFLLVGPGMGEIECCDCIDPQLKAKIISELPPKPLGPLTIDPL